MEQMLEAAEITVICDSIFAHAARQKPIPKGNAAFQYSAPQRQAISSMRIMCEWDFGDVQIQCPFLNDEWKQKSCATAPTLNFRMSTLLTNFLKCSRGCNSNDYTGVDALEPEDYYNLAFTQV